MGKTVADTIKEITSHHLTESGGLLLGQCVTAVGWIGGTVPDVKGIVEIPMTDVAGPGFAVGCALAGRRPIFIVRYQGFMWYNCSSLVNYAAKSMQIWGVPCPIFIRAIAMEGNGIGHTASSSLHSVFMHSPGMPVAAPMTPLEYREVWQYYLDHSDPIYCSEHRHSFNSDREMGDRDEVNADITVVAISKSRLNMLEAEETLKKQGINCNIFHLLWLKPFSPSEAMLDSIKRTGIGLVLDSDYEVTGASRSIAYELMHRTETPVHALGIEDRVCGAAETMENITPSSDKIVQFIEQLTSGLASKL
jgi:pyruvate/2-oxoglutarate/acetoin dehydrogenase E1 component